MRHPVTRTTQFPVPPVIKRNISSFAASQTFTGAGMQVAFGLGPLMVVALTNSASLAGLCVGVFGMSRFRAIGVNDSTAGASAVLAAVVTGPLVDWAGLPLAGVIAVLLAVVPLLMRAATRTKE